ncbi:TIR domain-containing protein [filamentous cyanobacterium LEGE 11480]|uniref:TIR domain-containing protein n=1 Tax=Romeriopsis navalis LEGE 11480 TaxID=2777977 RepID=A0A928VTL6_9CYAN|nr:TIR domain-containing protein [Romeriopsis navalis]MBE9031839.1 TIR domain-containing protein [Romeriopsis navalis LEGE 11480]
MSDIFISYSRKDSAFARRLHQAIEATGRDAWIDWQDIQPTVRWWQEIERGIQGANDFVFVISPDSIASSVCQKEINHAQRYNKRLVPIIYREGFVMDPASEAHTALNAHNWLWFREQDDFDQAFDLLIKAIEMDLQHVRTHTRLLQRSLEWTQQRSDSLLLRGDDLAKAEAWLQSSAQKNPTPTVEQNNYIYQSRQAEDTAKQRQTLLLDAKLDAEQQVRWGRIFLGGTAIVLVAAAGLAVFAVQSRNRAQQLNDTERQLNQATRTFKVDQITGALLTLTALKRNPAIVPDDLAQTTYEHWTVLGAVSQVFGEIREWNRLEGHRAVVSNAVVSPDGQLIATSGFDQQVKLWDFATGRLLHSWQAHSGWILGLAFSPDGKILATSAGPSKQHPAGSPVQLWDVQTRKPMRSLSGSQQAEEKRSVYTINFSPDGQTIATCKADGTIELWNVQTGKLRQTIKAHQGKVWSVQFGPQGKRLASSSEDKTIKLWDIQTGQLQKTLQDHQSSVRHIAFRPDGQVLASAGADNIIKLWDIASGKVIVNLTGHVDWVRRVRFSPDGRTLASASSDRTVKLWNVPQGKKFTWQNVYQINMLQGHIGQIYDVNFSPDGQTVVTASADQTSRLWRIRGGVEQQALVGHTSKIHELSFSPNSQLLATGSRDKTIKLWDAKQRRLVQTLDNAGSVVLSVRFSPNGDRIASGSGDGTLRIWQKQDGQKFTLSKTLKLHKAELQALAFSPDGKQLATGSADRTAKLLNLKTGETIREFTDNGQVISVAFSPDGQWIATGDSGQKVKLWNAKSDEPIATLKSHVGTVQSVAFSPDSKLLASGSRDRTIKLWDVEKRELVSTLQGHLNRVSTVSFHPSTERQMLVSGGADNSLIHWDVETGEIISSFQAANHRIFSAKYSPDGRTLASAGGDVIVRFNTNDRVSRWLDLGCQWLTPYLTSHPEKNRYQVSGLFGRKTTRDLCPLNN